MKTVIVFQAKELTNQICNEIACTPRIENGIGPVWLWYDPERLEQLENVIKYKHGVDGRCAICHNWSEVDRDWFLVYLDEWIQLGDVQILDELPIDWQYTVEVY